MASERLVARCVGAYGCLAICSQEESAVIRTCGLRCCEYITKYSMGLHDGMGRFYCHHCVKFVLVSYLLVLFPAMTLS